MTDKPRLTDEQIEELFERSKNDRAIIVGSEVRQLAVMAKALAAAEKRAEEAEKSIHAWFKKGQESVRRKNQSGCCCMIDDDGETILSPCNAHKAWAESQLAAAQKALRKAEDDWISLASEVSRVAQAAGIYNGTVMLDVPQYLLLVSDLGRALSASATKGGKE